MRKDAHRVHIIVYDIRMGVLLPAAGQGVLEQIARATFIVDRVESEIQGLPGFAA
jgi:hypothetical protein